MPVVFLLLGIGAIAAVVISQTGKAEAKTALPPDPRELENVLIIAMAAAKQKDTNPEYYLRLKQGAELAKALGMPLTAVALAGDNGLPQKELWPGTNLSVAAYMQQAVARRRVANVKKSADGIAQAARDIKGAGKAVKRFFTS